jgi:hypothetical protein
MYKLLISAIASVIVQCVTVSAAMLQGVVVCKETGRPIVGADVSLRTPRRNQTTDSSGVFMFPGVDTGGYILALSADGYQPQLYDSVRVTGDSTWFRFVLVPTPAIAQEKVVVSAARTKLIEPTPEVSKYSIRRDDLAAVPAAFGDVFRVIQTLPGVVAQSDFASSFSVRGGGTGENLVVLDGIPINEPLHLQGLPVSFNMLNFDMIRSVDFYSGNFPLHYGNKTGSVVDVHYRNGNTRKYSAKLKYDIKWLEALAEGPLPRQAGSFIVGVRQSYFRWLLGKVNYNTMQVILPQFFDVQGKLHFVLGQNNTMDIVYYTTSDNIYIPDGLLSSQVTKKEVGFHCADELLGLSLHSAFTPTMISNMNISYYRNNRMFGRFADGLQRISPEFASTENELVSGPAYGRVPQDYKNIRRVSFNGLFEYLPNDKNRLTFGYSLENQDNYAYEYQ